MNILFGAFKRLPIFKASAGFKMLTEKNFMTLFAQRSHDVKTHREEFLPFTINNLWDNPGSRRKTKRIGRGIGSGKGKTSTKGHKGQNARAGGGVHPQFEGGQTPLQQRLPKFGVFRKNKNRPELLNLSKLQYYIKSGRIDPSKTITIRSLYRAGVVSKAKYGVKILSRGVEEIDVPLNIEVSDASKRAIDIIKKAGGSVTCVYRTKLKIKEHLRPEEFPLPLADPIPPPRKIKYLEALEERGAKVVYNVPRWVQEEHDKLAKEEKDLKAPDNKKGEPMFPIKIYPGMGRKVVRKRKPVIYKQIDYKI